LEKHSQSHAAVPFITAGHRNPAHKALDDAPVPAAISEKDASGHTVHYKFMPTWTCVPTACSKCKPCFVTNSWQDSSFSFLKLNEKSGEL